MCVEIQKENYRELYFKFDEEMRYYLIRKRGSYVKMSTIKKMQGYEMLRIAWVAWKVDRTLTEEEMLDTVKRKISVETAKVQVEKNKNERDATLQKMVEVVRALGDNISPLEFVRGL